MTAPDRSAPAHAPSRAAPSRAAPSQAAPSHTPPSHGPLPPGATLGILGGGQLGRMLAMAAARLGYGTLVLDPDPLAPAAAVAGRHVAAPYDDDAALDALAACDAVTYEFENVPAAVAERLAARTCLAPPPAALAAAQDRLVEKATIARLGLPVAPHAAVDGADDLAAARAAHGDIVLKTRRMGYDGKGQAVIRAGTGDDEATRTLAALGGRDLVAEALVPLDAEVSVIAVRGRDGALARFDPARNVHENGILRSSTVPSGLGGALEAEARRMAGAIASGLDYVGALGVEFFVSRGKLLVNEIAPRVHNSGHWTEAVCPIDQFEAHVRAVMGLPIGDGRRVADAAMGNLLGEETAPRGPDIRVHLYGKREARAGRKMGHWTRVTPRDPDRREDAREAEDDRR